ncbi:gpW family head-tail joining protein [Zooshikella ganghwensis]|uniref:gpW family head-tail joining protein n=1 Tax=Zooshikella ganghwensis TaxID=202772 RepID=UPI00041F34D3|nr:gpW family head-tail joining protein [Zooshikella ganghwensis]
MNTEQRLLEARQALHQLKTGELRASIRDADGAMVTYHKPEDLKHYIHQLEAEINQSKQRRAFKFIF